MSYELNPNCTRLATNCFRCGRSLLDAKSVETGIGPICREKLGYDVADLSDEDRAKANALIHAAGIAAESGDAESAFDVADALNVLNFPKVADAIREKFVSIKISRAQGPIVRWDRTTNQEVETGRMRAVLQVSVPRSNTWNRLRKDRSREYAIRGYHRPVKEGRSFHWEFDAAQGRNVLETLRDAFPGKSGYGVKGLFKLEARDA